MLNKVLKLVKPKKFIWEEENLRKPNKDEVLLKMHYVGICGSDISVYKGTHPYAFYPRILGHEICAEIMEDGGPTGIFTTISPYQNCGNCGPCVKWELNRCLNNQTMGVQRNGAFQEYIIINKSGYNTNFKTNVDILQSIPVKLLSIVEPYFVGMNAASKISSEKKFILIIGCGPIGLYTALNIKFDNYLHEIYVADNNKFRLDMARTLGFNIDSSGEYDVVVEASGSENGIRLAINRTKPGGKIVLIGHNQAATINHSEIIKKELTIVGSRNSNNFGTSLKNSVYKLIQNKSAIEKTITGIIHFKDVPYYFERIDNKDVSFIKTLISFN